MGAAAQETASNKNITQAEQDVNTMHIAQAIIAGITAKDGKAPQWVLLFKAGVNQVAGQGDYLVDKQAFDLVSAYVAGRGNDVVWDYEHMTLAGTKAPAAGWIKELAWDRNAGIKARVEWTEEASAYIAKGEYRYFSPVFWVGKKDKRLVALHSVALTNSPKHNHLTPLLTKLGPEFPQGGNMDFFKTLFAKLGLADGATEEDVMAAITKLKTTDNPGKPVVAKEVLDALGLKPDADLSETVATIHATKQQAGQASAGIRQELDALKKQVAEGEAEKVVAKALEAGKIMPSQKDWAAAYAVNDPKGFETFVAKAPVVVPMGRLPRKTTEGGAAEVDEATKMVAKMMGVTGEDIKKYGGADAE